MFLRLFALVFCFSILAFSISDKESRSIASIDEVAPIYDASYKL